MIYNSQRSQVFYLGAQPLHRNQQKKQQYQKIGGSSSTFISLKSFLIFLALLTQLIVFYETMKVTHEQKIKQYIETDKQKSQEVQEFQISQISGFEDKLNNPSKYDSENKNKDILDGKQEKKQNITFANGGITEFYTRQPNKYILINQIQAKQLPFCILTNKITNLNTLKAIQLSLQQQNYTNFQFYFTIQNENSSSSVSNNQHLSSKQKNSEYLQLRKLILQNCTLFSVILLTHKPLVHNCLKQLNTLYQQYNIWMTYSSSNFFKTHGIQTFYHQIFLNAIDNDYRQKRVLEIEEGDFGLLALTMLKLAEDHVIKISSNSMYQQLQTIFENHLENFTGILIKRFSSLGVTSKMFSLSQNYQVQQRKVKSEFKKLLQNKEERYIEGFGITKEQMMQAIEYLQIKNLPINHSLNTREQLYYQKKYNISQYTQQLPFCVVIPTFNNIQNQRFIKSLHSVYQQNYQNYHVVLIDDCSTDDTFELTKKYAQHLGIENKIDFIRNEKRRYATYNIYQGVKDFCKKDEIVILVDGDDELIGRQVFKLINSIYQQKNYWIVYTNYMKSDYSYGRSRPINPKFFLTKKRTKFHLMSPLRTFYRSLYMKIQQKDHKSSSGQFLQALYDEAMQYPLFQMAGPQRIRYLPQITYFYNTNYGNNDDSTIEKINLRKNLHEDIVSRRKYEQIDNLNE